MRMLLPPLKERREIRELLSEFFQTHHEPDFNNAIRALCRFYTLPVPKIEWYETLDWGKSGGLTYEDGRIKLIHPENWKRGTKYNTEAHWIKTVFHEFGHFMLWSDPETKAELFATRLMRSATP